MTKQELEAVYDRLYDKADKVLKTHNPCAIRDAGACATCRGSRFAKAAKQAELPFQSPGILCCGNCPHHDREKGCTVRALGCKLWLCGQRWPFMDIGEVIEKQLPAIKELEKIRQKAGKYFPYLTPKLPKNEILQDVHRRPPS